MSVQPLEILKFFQGGGRLYTSESDVYRRQILTYKDDPRAERLVHVLSVVPSSSSPSEDMKTAAQSQTAVSAYL